MDTMPFATCDPAHAPLPLLEAVRRKEAEVKRRLAAEYETAQVALAEAEQQARERVTTAKADGWREGNAQRQAAQAEAEREAEAILSQACHEAEALQRVGAGRMEAAVRRAIEIVIGVRR